MRIAAIILCFSSCIAAEESRYKHTPNLEGEIKSMRAALKDYNAKLLAVVEKINFLSEQEQELLRKIDSQKGLFQKLITLLRSYKEPMTTSLVLTNSTLTDAVHTQIGIRSHYDLTKGVFRPLLDTLQQIITIRKTMHEQQIKQKELTAIYRSISDQLTSILNQSSASF